MAAPKEEVLRFSVEIEKLVKDKQLNYIEAITHYCELNGVEIELVIPLINSNLKAKLAETASSLNLIAKTSRLPF